QVHNGVISVNHLCVRAQQGRMDPVELLQSLRSFRAMQVTELNDLQGCLRWYWEEPEPVDTNASFFIGLALQMLYLAEPEKLCPAARASIREIVQDLAIWFGHELAVADPRYPNKCMGDLVCSWLATEILEVKPSAQLRQTTRAWCDYWTRENWGWGEHMSDIYTMVLLTELSAVLLFCPKLPPDISELFRAKFFQLMDIEDAFTGGPRVPVIRSYAFNATPELMPFRSFIRAELPPGIVSRGSHPSVTVQKLAEVFGVWFHRAGWEKMAPPKLTPAPWVEIACRDGAVARAMVTPILRLGAMSHYPIMEGVDHQTWGLSWQTFPAALWRPRGDWAFWRWTTREGDRVRAHPALDKHSAYLGNALSARVDPPPIPRMKSNLTSGGPLLMERSLPVPAGANWEELCDAFCLLGSDAKVTAEDRQLSLEWSDCTVRVKFRGETMPEWKPAETGGQWVVHYDRASLAGRECITHHWELALV
ncbi:MAG: hypothetical protein K9M98_14385, partial [Cephaloticoccus sp.]|nr:hypothetical protein [Cephaloticoccus sp.]